jgi:hypothetical protein
MIKRPKGRFCYDSRMEPHGERTSPEQAEVGHENPNPHIDDEIRQRLEAEGWQLAGQEYPLKTSLDSDTGRFEPVRIMTDEMIKQKFLEQYDEHGFDEAMIEPSHSVETGLANESRVYVFLRKEADRRTKPTE